MNSAVKQEILEHLSYSLEQIDGGIWRCKFNPSGAAAVVEVRVGQALVQRAETRVLTNALAEAALVHNRKLVEFLGIKLRRKRDELCAVDSREDDDAGIEQIGGIRLTVQEFLSFGPEAPPGEVSRACVHALRAASKGVAHFTNTGNFKAYGLPTLLSLETTRAAVEECAYQRLGRPVPNYRVWCR